MKILDIRIQILSMSALRLVAGHPCNFVEKFLSLGIIICSDASGAHPSPKLEDTSKASQQKCGDRVGHMVTLLRDHCGHCH